MSGNGTTDRDDLLVKTAHAVRAACLQAALEGYERAGLGGLCEEGRLEMMADAVRTLEVEPIIRQCLAEGHPGPSSI